MSVQLFLLIALSVGLSSAAQLVLKLGIGAARVAGAAAPGEGAVAEVIGLLLRPMVLVGLSMYGLAAMLWLLVLARAELSLAYPFVGVGFIVTMLVGYTAFGEPISLARTCGTVIIALGCILVARSA